MASGCAASAGIDRVSGECLKRGKGEVGRMQIQVVNRRAMARYATFWSALVMVNECVTQARKVAEELGDLEGSKQGLAAASGQEIQATVKRADKSLGTL